MSRVSEFKAELKKIRKELEFIEGQLTNESILGGDAELGCLSYPDIDRLMAKNDKLMTEVIVLETLLEDGSLDLS